MSEVNGGRPQANRPGSARYGRYTGGPDPLAPPLDLSAALDEVAEDVMYGYSPDTALAEYLRRGTENVKGLDELAGEVQKRRRELLAKHNLGATLEQVKALLDDAVLAERGQLARDITMDETDRAFREMQMENLPDSPAAAVNELADYDWKSSAAREKFDQIKDLLGREMLDQRFEGMKQALENATDDDRAAVADMIKDLNELLEKRARGEDTEQDFQDFMAKHGDQFPENPQNLDELIDALAKRSAAAQRMLNSMSREQQEELMALSQQAFGSPEISEQLSRLDANLQGLRPGEDWGGSEDFSGDDGMGLGEATSAMQELADLDDLADQLAQNRPGSTLSDVDVEKLSRRLGEQAGVDVRTLADLEKQLRSSNLLRSGTDGSLRLTPAALRRLGKALLRDAAQRLSGRAGARDARLAGAAGELTGATRPWQFGDTEPWDVGRTVTNAIVRTGRERTGSTSGATGRGRAQPGRSGPGVQLRVGDVEVQETEERTQAAVALLADTSFSMAAEGRWVPMKRTALALHHLVSTRFRGDVLELISFGTYAKGMPIDELTALQPINMQGTNLHHALLLAAQFFRRHPGRQPVLLIVTDGEPTAHLLPGGQPWFSWPPEPATIEATVAELDRVARMGAQTTFFRLGDDPGLERFLDAMAKRAGGTVVAPETDDLGAAVVGEFLRSRPGPGTAAGPAGGYGTLF